MLNIPYPARRERAAGQENRGSPALPPAKVHAIVNAARVSGKQKQQVAPQTARTEEQCDRHNLLAIFRSRTSGSCRVFR